MNKVYFIYIGGKLPKYAIASIRLAKKYSGLKIHLIANSICKKQIQKLCINFTSIESFYCSKKFKNASKSLNLNENFRNGFWLKTLERFFILEQFMIKKKIHSIFHAEIDQLLFRCDKLISSIKKTNKKGLFVPFHNKNYVVASIIFINKLSVLKSIIQSIDKMRKCSNDMELLAAWSKKNPKKIFALPTLATEFKYLHHILPKNVNIIKAKEIGGVVDAAQLGQWVGGIDPKNVSILRVPRTKFVDEPKRWLLSLNDLKQIQFKWMDNKNHQLNLNFKKKKFQIYNLHFHCKMHHNIVNKNPSIFSLIVNSNSSQSMIFDGIRIIQIQYFFLDYFSILKSYLQNPFKIYFFLKRKLFNDKQN